MIVVQVHLVSAVNGQVTELARMHISNIGGTNTSRDYEVTTLRGRDKVALDRRQVQRQGKVLGHASLALHVWHLVGKSLAALGYGTGLQRPGQAAAASEPREPAQLL